MLADMDVLADPFARVMLTRTMTAIVGAMRVLPNRLSSRSVTLAGLAARVLWFDNEVANSLDAGITQVVVIGAGYDSRAWRFRRAGVQFFELDHRATQRDKVARAPGSGPTYVEADLTTRSAAEALRACGLDASRPALFLVEGVTMYLGEEVVRRQLGELATSSAVESRLAVDFYPPPGAGTSQNHRQTCLQRLARAGSGEGFRLVLDRRRAIELVEAAGWRVEEATTLRGAARALVPRSSGLPIDAVNDHKTLLAGVHI